MGDLELHKFDLEGNEIETTEAEQDEFRDSLRRGLTGLGGWKIEFAPGALEDMKDKGMTEDQILAMLAESLGLKQ